MEKAMREFYILALTASVVTMFSVFIVATIVADYIINALITAWRKIYYVAAIINIAVGVIFIYGGKGTSSKGWGIISLFFGIAFFINALRNVRGDSNERTTVPS